jgi:integrase
MLDRDASTHHRPAAAASRVRAPLPRRERLTDALIRSMPLAPAGESYRVNDAATPGLRLEVGTRGRTWVAQWEGPKVAAGWGARRGRTFRVKLGKWPDVRVRDARAAAQRAIGAIKAGNDPRSPRRPSGPTLADALVSWSAQHERLGRSPSSREAYRDVVERLCADWLQRPLADLASDQGRADVRTRHEDLSVSTPAMANQFARIVGALYRHARRTHLSLPIDPPTAGVTRNPSGTRAPSGLLLAGLPSWWAIVRNVEPVRRAHALLGLLCGARPRVELAALRWDDVSVLKRTVHFAAPKGHRPGRDRSFELPITRPMMRALMLARRHGGSREYVFPSPHSRSGRMGRGRPRGISAWGHDLRHSFASIAEELGFTEADYGPLLNHQPASVTGGYPNRAAVRMTRGRQVLEAVQRAMIQALTADTTERRQLSGEK